MEYKEIGQMADASGIMIWMAGCDAVCHYFNNSWLEFTGRSLAVEIGINWLDKVYPEDLQYQDYVTAFESHQKFTRKYRLRRGDGEYRWILEQATPQFATNGDFTGYIGHCIDITEIQQAKDEELEFFEISLDMFWIIDFDGYFQNLNSACLGILGWKPQQLRATPLIDFIHSEDKEITLAEFRKIASGIDSINFENRFLCKDGSWRWISWTIKSVPEKQRMYAVIRDVTEHKINEKTLQKSYSLLYSVVDSTADFIFAKDVQGRLAMINSACADFLKQPIKNLLGKRDSDLFPQHLAEKLVEIDQRVITTGVAETVEEVLDQDGKIHLTTKSPWRDRQGEIIGIISIARDISDRKRTEKILLEQARLAGFRADVNAALTKNDNLQGIMHCCTEAIVKHLNAAFARIWTLNKQTNVLELQVSSGMYTHVDGNHKCVPVGQFKIGLIAQEGKPHLTNSVQTDERISNKEWAVREGMIAFAGYPLIVVDEIVGVIAMFSRQALSESVLSALEFVSDEIAIGINRKQTEVALRKSEAKNRAILEAIPDLILRISKDGVLLELMSAQKPGFSPDKLAGKSIYDILPRDLAQQGIARINEAITTGEMQVFEYQIVVDEVLRFREARIVPNCEEEVLAIIRDITERQAAQRDRQLAQQALRESEARNSAIVNAIPDLIFRFSQEGKYLDCMAKKVDELAIPLNKIIGKSVYDTLPSVLAKQVIHYIQQALLTDNIQIYEYQLPVNGEMRDFESRIVPSGKNEVLAIVRNITQRKRAEAALAESEAKFRSLVENANDIIFSLTTDGVYTYISPNFTDLLGYEVTEFLGKSFVPLVHSDDLPLCIDFFTRTLTTGEKQNLLEFRLKHQDGTHRWYRCNSSVVFDEKGDVVSFVGIAHDITERKESEAALQAVNQRLASVINNAPIILYALDTEGKFIFSDGKGLEKLGLKPNQVVGQNVFEMYREEPTLCDDIRRTFRGEQTSWITEFSGIVYDTQATPLFNENNEITGIICVSNDITERKQAEDALQALVAGTASVTGSEFFRVLVRHLAAALGTRYAFVVERIEAEIPLGQTLAWWEGDKLGENFQYKLINNACELLTPDNILCYPHSARELFPLSPDFKALQAESYVGMPIVDTSGQMIGLICAIDTKPLLQSERAKAILSIFAARATAEIQRQRTENSLRLSEKRFRELAAKETLINRLSSQIRASLDINTILETAVTEIGSLLKIDRCNFSWYESGVWRVVQEAKNPDLPSYVGTVVSEEQVSLFVCGSLKEITRIDDIRNIPNSSEREFLLSFGSTALLTVPIHTQSGKIGLITCMHCTDLRPWLDSEVELLQAVTDQIAIAIDQAEIYKQSRIAAQIAQDKATELESALHELSSTQAQLIQTEKMSSLGQLVAGIAHEINNPVNFIYGNINYASEYTQDLLHIVELYRQHYIEIPDIQKEIQTIDLDFIAEDFPKLLDSMKIGAERIREIVLSLRNFSRLDEAEMKAVNIHEGIDNTLLLLQNRLKPKPGCPEIQVIKKYSDLPKVECYPGQLNQVFMNLLANAIDALEEKVETVNHPTEAESRFKTWEISQETYMEPQIIIDTQIQDNYAIIRIIDNALGMTEEVRARLFDPFFTTKPVGKGTGMGLSISYKIIVEKHQGKFECTSVLGQGTEFTISIPLMQA